MSEESAAKTMRVQLDEMLATKMGTPRMEVINNGMRVTITPPRWSLRVIQGMPVFRNKTVAVVLYEEKNMLALVDNRRDITHAEIYNPPRSLLKELDKMI